MVLPDTGTLGPVPRGHYYLSGVPLSPVSPGPENTGLLVVPLPVVGKLSKYRSYIVRTE